MTTERYTTILGEVIEYPAPTPDVAAFLARVKRDAHDPAVTEAQLSELVYGRENPVLDQTVFPGRGAVTKAVHANPVWHVMQDLLDAKRVQTGRLDAGAVNAAFALTVSEAAARLGITEGAVRQAITSEKLAAVKRGSAYFIDPASVETYRARVKRRGPRAEPALEARIGNAPGASFMVKADEEIETCPVEGAPKGARVFDAKLARFTRAAVKFGGKTGQRMFVIERGDEPNEFALGPFWIRGRYRVVEKINNPAEAAARWKAFGAEEG
jgi:excisionase family DNA binding protein